VDVHVVRLLVPKVAYSVKLRTMLHKPYAVARLPVRRRHAIVDSSAARRSMSFSLRDARPPFRARGVVSVLFRAVGTLDGDAALSMFGPQS
jgi:hypothetical protein